MNDTNHIGIIHTNTTKMQALSHTIERLHPTSPARATAIAEYIKLRDEAKACLKQIPQGTDDRALGRFELRTVRRPTDNAGIYLV
jgi:hypothetical protein